MNFPVNYKVWCIMQDWVYQTPIYNVDILKWRLIAAWSGIQQSVIDNAIDQWRVRLRTWVKANGRHVENMLWLSWLVFACFVSVFCLGSYLTLPSDFGVHHCECQSDSLLVLKGTVGVQKIGVVENTIQVLLQFSSGVSLPKKYANQHRIHKVIAKIKRVQFFWNTVYNNWRN